MKALNEFINESLQRKTVSQSFKDAFDALTWLEEEVDIREFGIAYIEIPNSSGKTGWLTFGYDANSRGDELYLHFEPHRAKKEPYLILQDDYEDMPKGEFCDMINRCIVNEQR